MLMSKVYRRQLDLVLLLSGLQVAALAPLALLLLLEARSDHLVVAHLN